MDHTDNPIVILSFDCGTVNIGYTAVKWFPIKLLDELPKCRSITDIQKLLRSQLVILESDSFNITGGLKLNETTDQERSKNLKLFLTSLDERVGINDISQVLIEYQMGPNDKSRGVSWQLLYHYGMKAVIVGPTLKNLVVIDPTEKGTYQYHLQHVANRKKANKEHTKHNFIKYLEYTDQMNLLPNKKKLDDVADSFCQILGHFGWLYSMRNKTLSLTKVKKRISKKNTNLSKIDLDTIV